MTKKEFMEKYEFNEFDYLRLLSYERNRNEGRINMSEYLSHMERNEEVYAENDLSSLILKNDFYSEFLETLKEKEND
jgi:hypothetical protein